MSDSIVTPFSFNGKEEGGSLPFIFLKNLQVRVAEVVKESEDTKFDHASLCDVRITCLHLASSLLY